MNSSWNSTTWDYEPEDLYDELLEEYFEYDDLRDFANDLDEHDLSEWKDEIVTKIVKVTSLTSAYVREIIDNDYEDYFWDDYSSEQIVEMFLEDENGQ